MSFRFATLLLTFSPLLLPGGPVFAADAEQIKADEQTMKSVGMGTDGPALLQFFRTRTLADADRSRIALMIQGLGDDAYEVREKASDDLVSLGSQAVSLLRQATRNEDIEVVRRAEHCLQLIDKVAGTSITCSAARLLANRKPAGSAEALLAFIPFADDEIVLEEVRNAVSALVVRDGKPQKCIVDALGDKLPARRAVAAEALARSGLPEQTRAMRRLLDDPDSVVRLRVGLALVDARDKEAIPPLINLLAELPREQCWPVEDVLCRLAGEQAPNVSLGSDDLSRKRCKQAWGEWWTKNGAKLDLAKLDTAQRLLGYTLIVQMDIRGFATGKVIELGVDGKPRWQIDNLQQPMDAHVLSNDRVLITEYRNRRITERNFKGDIIWEKTVLNMPMAAQRLSNGNTFITCQNQLVEVDKTGKEVFSHVRNNYDIMAAQKLRNGHMVFLTQMGQYVDLDAAGKEVKSLQLGQNQVHGSNFEVLTNGNILVPLYNNNKVIEYNPDGKSVWEATVNFPTAVSRLPNGHTLVASMYNQQVIEIDKAGKQVWDYRPDGRVYRVRRR